MNRIQPQRFRAILHDGFALCLILCLTAVLVLLQDCSQPSDPVFNNPNDSLAGTFTPPEITITQSPADGSTWPQRHTFFAWTGNSTAALYSFKLDSAAWSPWDAAKSVDFESLDDDVHVFQVKAQHTNASNETEPLRRTFTIDLLPHPSFFIVPNLTRPKVGDHFLLYLRVKNIDLLMTMSTALSYGGSIFTVDAVDVVEAFLEKNHGTIVAFTSNDQNAGRIDANLGVAVGVPKGVQGTGNLLRLTCRALSVGSDSLTIRMDSTVVRDTSNVPVSIAGYANGRVIVQ